MNVAQNLRAVRECIARTGRDPAEVAIVAVTKGFGAEVCLEAIAAGLTMLGENRVQEALPKMDVVAGVEWHLIGHLQSNKARRAAGRFALIQSIDSVRLAEQVARAEPRQRVLVEVNVARDPQKSGVAPHVALDVAVEVATMLDLQGLMAMGPNDGDPAPVFSELCTLRERAQERLGRALPILSMGMSSDFEAALSAGSTMLRLGQVLFGPRPN